MKKFIYFFLAVFLTVNISTVPAFAGEASAVEYNTEAVALFEATGLLEHGNSFVNSDEAYISRAEFSSLLVRMLGIGNSPSDLSAYTTAYKDISQDTRYASDILFCSDAGFFGSELKSWFYPHENASASWAADSVARLLGYKELLEFNPQTAYTLGLMDGISASEEGLYRSDAIKLLYNALDVPVMEAVTVSGKEVILDPRNERNFLSVYFKTEVLDDVMLSDEFTSVYGEKADAGMVVFTSGTYISDNIDTRNLVGLSLRIYYCEEGSRNKLLYAQKLENTQVILGTKNTTYDYRTNSYTSEIGGKSKVFKMELETMVSYNGKPHFDKNKMLPESGQIKLIDNDSDGKYEVCIVKEYTNLITGSCDAESERVFDAFSRERDVDFSLYEKYVIYNEKYEQVSLSSVKKDSVLTLYESADGKDAEAYISEKSAPAKLESIDFHENIMISGDARYRIASDFRTSEELLRPGNTYSFFLNHHNEVVYASVSWEHETLYIMDTNATKGLDRKYMVKGLSKTGGIEEYELADKVNYITYPANTARLKSEEAFSRLNSDNGRANRQLVKFCTDLNGRICEIVIAYDVISRDMADGLSTGYPLLRLSYYSDASVWPQSFLTYVPSADKNRVYYKNGVFGYFMPLVSGAHEMIVPLNSTGEYSDSDVYSWVWTPLQTTPSAYVENFDAYSTTGDGINVDCLVSPVDSRTSRTDGGYNLQPYLVLGVSQILDENHDAVTRLKLSNRNGNVSDYYVADENLLEREALINESKSEGEAGATIPSGKSGIAKGDIIAAQLNSSGRIERLRLVYDGASRINIHPSTSSEILNSSSDIIVGKVVRSGSGFVEFISQDGSDVEAGVTMVDKLSGGIVRFDARLCTVDTITADELYPDDIIHIYTRYGLCRMVVVYKNL